MNLEYKSLSIHLEFLVLVLVFTILHKKSLKLENAILDNLYYPSNIMVKSLDYLNITLEKILLSEFFFFPQR